MKIVAILCWYDESPTWLSHVIAGAARAGCSHVVAVDGPYALYSSTERSSGVEQQDAIARACHASGLGLSMHVPDHAFIGNEIEKRNLAFRIAEQVTSEDDWLLVVDADMVVTRALGLRHDLEGTELDVASVQLVDRYDWHTDDGRSILPDGSGVAQKTSHAHRALFRARRGLEVVNAHFIYRYPHGEDWRYLWGPENWNLEPALNLPNVEIEHWTRQRNAHRAELQKAYYATRDEARVERVGRLVMETVDGEIAELP
jgi:hypothetical protein